MKYYCIAESLDAKTVGIYPQVEEAKYHCDVWNEPKFIDRVKFEELNFDPIVANAILRKKAKPTDLISAGVIGFSLKLLISGTLKKILETTRKTGRQFFNAPIIHKDNMLEDYWVLNIYEIDMRFVDFGKSDVFLTENVFTNIEKLNVNSLQEFLSKKEEIDRKGYPYGILIERFELLPEIDQDIFALLNVSGGVKYIVSEGLKKEIEEAGCTGIEFMPVELTLSEWLQGGEREKVYGKV